MSYYIGDIPADKLLIVPARGDTLIDLTPFTSATATLRDDTGTIVPTVTLAATLNKALGEVAITWPAVSPFTRSGVFYVAVTLDGAGIRERVPPVPLIVDEENDGWLSLDAARDSWADAPAADLDLFETLWVAKQQVIVYAPALDPLLPRPPLNYRKGQAMQARNIWNAAKVDAGSGGFGEGSFVIRPFPLDWMIKQILRPATAIPKVG